MSEALQTQLKKDYVYDQETGQFFSARNNRRWKAGRQVGYVDRSNGYVTIHWKGRNHYAHRLAWLYMHGHLPLSGIDHINGIKTDNRLSNLREATQSQNRQNAGLQKNNKSGFTGVTFCSRRGLWRARVARDYREHHIGYFPTPELAHQAYLDAKKKIHTFNPIPREEIA